MYLGYCKEIREKETECNRAVNHYLSGNKSFVTIGIPRSRIEHMQRFLAELMQMNKDYEVRIVTASSKEIETLAERKEVDLAVVNESIHQNEGKLLFSEEIYLCVPEKIQKERGLQEKSTIRLKDFENETFYLSTEENMLGRKAKEIFDREGFKPKKVKTFDNSWLSIELAKNEDAIAFAILIGDAKKDADYFSLCTPVYNNVLLVAETTKGKAYLHV